MSARLTTAIREAIVDDLVKHRFEDAVKGLYAQRAALADAVYRDLYTKAERDQIDGEKEDAEALFNAEFALMTGELAHLLPAVVQALGGEIAVAPAVPAPDSAVASTPAAQPAADDPPF